MTNAGQQHNQLKEERKKKKALEELQAMNNEKSPQAKSKPVKENAGGNKKRKTMKNDKKRPDAAILKDRKRAERQRKRSPVGRVRTKFSKPWKGWRTYEEPSPVITYNMYELDSNNTRKDEDD